MSVGGHDWQPDMKCAETLLLQGPATSRCPTDICHTLQVDMTEDWWYRGKLISVRTWTERIEISREDDPESEAAEVEQVCIWPCPYTSCNMGQKRVIATVMPAILVSIYYYQASVRIAALTLCLHPYQASDTACLQPVHLQWATCIGRARRLGQKRTLWSVHPAEV